MIHLPHWLPAFLIRPLGWALLHSLWQVALIALLYRGLELATRGRSPRLRYGIGCVALVACAAAPMLTTAMLATPADPLAAFPLAAGVGTASAPSVPHEAARPAGALGGLVALVDARIDGVVLAWIVGAALGLALLVRSWWRAGRLAARASAGPDLAAAHEILDRTRRRLGVRRAVRLARSASVESPALVGWLAPTILLSRCRIGDDVLEPVLAHELAHVHRHDYAANLLQSTLERLLFFNPGLRWLSRQVRFEREACCDELAARCCSRGTRGYVRALAALETSRSRVPALGATEGDLLRRIRRLVEPDAVPSRPAWGLCLVLACAAGVALAGEVLQRSAAATVIDGLDPVLLVAGQRVPGSPALAIERGGYRYLFAGSESRSRFLADPHRFSVRNVRLCPSTGRRVLPGAYRVIDGHIVLFCCPEVGGTDLRHARALVAASRDIATD